MILHESNPIITDIFIRSQDRNTLLNSDNQEEMDALVRSPKNKHTHFHQIKHQQIHKFKLKSHS